MGAPFSSPSSSITRRKRGDCSLAAISSFVLLVVFLATGSHVFFHWDFVAGGADRGGMSVIAAGWALLKKRDENDRGAVGCTMSTDVLRDAFYPLTLPLTVGPGSISIAITLGANEPHHFGAGLLALLGSRGCRRLCLFGCDDLSLLCVCGQVKRSSQLHCSADPALPSPPASALLRTQIRKRVLPRA